MRSRLNGVGGEGDQQGGSDQHGLGPTTWRNDVDRGVVCSGPIMTVTGLRADELGESRRLMPNDSAGSDARGGAAKQEPPHSPGSTPAPDSAAQPAATENTHDRKPSQSFGRRLLEALAETRPAFQAPARETPTTLVARETSTTLGGRLLSALAGSSPAFSGAPLPEAPADPPTGQAAQAPTDAMRHATNSPPLGSVSPGDVDTAVHGDNATHGKGTGRTSKETGGRTP